MNLYSRIFGEVLSTLSKPLVHGFGDDLMSDSKTPVFLRDATGLVKGLTTFDTFALGVTGVTPGVTMCLFYMYIVYLYPGVNMTLTSLGSIPIALIYAGVYYLLSIAMPRSGGDYVYGSRIIHPLWGLLPNWMYIYAQVVAFGFLAASIGSGYLGPLLAMLGSFYKSPTLLGWSTAVATVNIAFAISIVAIWLSFVVNIPGLRSYAKWQLVTFIISIAAIVASLIILAGSNNQAYQVAFNRYAAQYNTTYTGVIQEAENAGWKPATTASISDTSQGLVYMAGTSLATVFPVLAGGEIRNPKKSLFWGTIGAIVFCGLLFVGGAVFLYGTAGDEFVKALAFITNNGVSTNPLPAPPLFQYLTSILVQDNPGLIMFIGIGWLLGLLILFPAYYLVISRSMFAWSFDRIIPAFFADVNDKFHAPMKTLITTALLTTGAAAMTLYTNYLGLFFNITLAVVSSFLFAGVAAAVFPYVKRARAMWEQAPPIVRTKVAGVPLISILGITNTVIMLWLTYLDLISPALSGPVNPVSVGIVGAVYVLAIAVYLVSKVYHRSHGLNIDLAFQQIPPE